MLKRLKEDPKHARRNFAAIATATVPVIANELPPERRIAVFQIMEIINRYAGTVEDARILIDLADMTIDRAIAYRTRIDGTAIN